MKIKSIKTDIKNKIEHWLLSIRDANMKEEIKNNCILTGGAIASMLLDEKVNDYDIYFTNKNSAVLAAQYYVNTFNQSNSTNLIVDDTTDRIRITDGNDNVVSISCRRLTTNYGPKFISSNAVTLANDIQLVFRFYGPPEIIHSNYDFIHCTNYWLGETEELILKQEALQSLLTKELIYVGSKYPLCSMIRTRKFIKRGFSCDAGQFVKMGWQISQLDLNDIYVLEDQLMGVDVQYFHELIASLKSAQQRNVNITYDYISGLIDEIFQGE